MTKKHCLLFSFNSKFTQSNIAIHYLDAFGKKYNPECQFDTFELSINWPFQDALAKVFHRVKDVIAISCYIWNIDRTIELVKALRLIRPDLIIILGGYEVSFDSLTYLEKGYCNYVISGEGEIIFSNLMKAISYDADPSHIAGLSYINNKGECVKNQAQDAIEQLDTIPSPFQGNPEILDKSFTYYESTRGCVYKCHFCLSALDKGSRFFSHERFVKDMESILASPTIKQIKFVDRTFNLGYKRTNFILGYLMEHGQGRNYHFEIACELLHKTTLELLREAPAGLFQFEIGVQSIHDSILKANGRSCDFQKLERNLDFLLANTKVHIHLDLVVGLSEQTPEHFEESFNWTFHKKADHFQIETLKVLKGSLSKRFGDRDEMVHQLDPPYNLLQNKHFSFTELEKTQRMASVLEVYYNRDHFRMVIFEIAPLFTSPLEFVQELTVFFQSKHMGFTGVNLKTAYTILYDFLVQIEAPKSVFNLLTLDYLYHFQSGGQTPFEKRSSTINRPKYQQVASSLKMQKKGFIEEFDEELDLDGVKSSTFYFGGRNEPSLRAVDLTNDEYKYLS
ncbi:MAG: DUF4080 domain-containing protein [Candidatus Cloacimonetes bacterium]|nr:DUF4080 domain-containing protein [Candidatus Cloacimonadota bacterium]